MTNHKKIGTSNLKSLVENDKLIINDFDIISELSTFIARGKSFEVRTKCDRRFSDVSCYIF